jgi:hypothetical protein
MNYSNVTSCTPDDQFGVNVMHLPTLAGMMSDLIKKVVDVTVPSYLLLPYMNMHKYPIKIDQRTWAECRILRRTCAPTR